MEEKEITSTPGQNNNNSGHDDTAQGGKGNKKERIRKGERKKKARALDEEEEEKTIELNLADLEALKHKDEDQQKGKGISSILKDYQKDEEMLSKLTESERRGECDIRVAIIGNVDSGKSTLVGVLSKGELDDGRGAARLKVFNFTHEAENGRTSSIGQEIMGFDEENKWVEPERVKATKNPECLLTNFSTSTISQNGS